MATHGDNKVRVDGSATVNAAWFDRKREQYSKGRENKDAVRMTINEEIAALQAFYNLETDAQSCAYRITHPIASTPIPPLPVYSPECVAILKLWYILCDALVQWPPGRVADLLNLLSAIRELPKTVQIHNGEATDMLTGTEPLTWDTFPWFSMAWGDSLRDPGEIIRLNAKDSGSILSREQYIYRKEIEAQLIARGVLTFNHYTVKYVTKTLETEPDTTVPENEAAAYRQNRIEFQIPAVAFLLQYCGAQLFEWVVGKNGDNERWNRWEERLKEIANDESDQETQAAAKVASDEMQAIRARN